MSSKVFSSMPSIMPICAQHGSQHTGDSPNENLLYLKHIGPDNSAHLSSLIWVVAFVCEPNKFSFDVPYDKDN